MNLQEDSKLKTSLSEYNNKEQIFTTSDKILSITLDGWESQIYWSTAVGIFTRKYDSTHIYQAIAATDDTVYGFFSLQLFKNDIYWIDDNTVYEAKKYSGYYQNAIVALNQLTGAEIKFFKEIIDSTSCM